MLEMAVIRIHKIASWHAYNYKLIKHLKNHENASFTTNYDLLQRGRSNTVISQQ